MPRHPPIALKTLDRSHCQYPSARSRRDRRFSQTLAGLAKRDLAEIVALERQSLRDCASMELAQKDQLLEIGSRARLGKPIICKGLSVPCDKSCSFRIMKFEQIFSLRCQTEQAQSTKLGANSLSNDFLTISTPTQQSCRSRRDDPADRALARPQRGGRKRRSCGSRIGGAGRDRTDDILLAKQALSQLSYGP